MGGRGNGATRNSNVPVLERMDTSTLTASQKKVMDRAYDKVEFARTHTIDEWALNSVTRGDSLEEYRPVKFWNSYGYKSKQEAINATMKDAESYKKNYGKFYEAEKIGQPLTTASTNTLKALEKRGYIRIVEAGGKFPDRVEIVERRKK